MRILANENFPREAVRALRKQGHDVVWIREAAPGIGDTEVLERAVAEDRILITFDKDFGEPAFRRGLPASCGVILFRILMPSAEYVAEVATRALEQREEGRTFQRD